MAGRVATTPRRAAIAADSALSSERLGVDGIARHVHSLHFAGVDARDNAARIRALDVARALLLGPGGFGLLNRIRVAGHIASAVTITQTVPGLLLHLYEGQNALLRVTNTPKEDISIYWHGLILPPEMDGVPSVSFPGIRPGQTFELSDWTFENPYRCPIG